MTPITNALIQKVMDKFPSEYPHAQERFYEAVHQEVVPLARRFEIENQKLIDTLESIVELHGKRIFPHTLSKVDCMVKIAEAALKNLHNTQFKLRR